MANENIGETVKELQKLLNIENFIGQPIESEDKVLIPVMRVGFGFGTAQKIQDKGTDNVIGAGAGAEPVSMVAIPKNSDNVEGIRVINLTSGTERNKAINDLGLMVSNLINDYVVKPKKDDEDYDEAEFVEPTEKSTDSQ